MKAIAEAPSKTIITGEHFVVHGAWALAAALPKRVRVEVAPARSLRVTSDRFPSGSPSLGPATRVVEAMSKEYSFSPRVTVRIASAVPQGAGLGSSASTMVALVSALSRFHSLGLGVDEVVGAAMQGEAKIHGNPSGIDPSICAYGGVILFRRGSPPRRLSLRKPASLILCYSGVRRSTKGQIGKVASAKERYPGLFASLAAAVGELSLEAGKYLVRGDMEGLGRILTVNHAALSFMGVSNDTLDTLVDQLASMGALGAKLTGAGGGGSVVAVVPKAKEKSILSGLSRRGLETFKAEVPVGGVRSWLEQ